MNRFSVAIASPLAMKPPIMDEHIEEEIQAAG
jgi:hypothetical protein